MAVYRVTYWQIRDRLDDGFTLKMSDYPNAPSPMVTSAVLHYLVRNAKYTRCSDDNYGDVTYKRCGVDIIASTLFISESSVIRALRTLVKMGFITRKQGGRRAHRADYISVRPLLDQL
jgi:hypothetical protein